MTNLRQPKHVQLTPPGPYVLPAAVSFLGLTMSAGRLPVQMRFSLEDGSELHLPISEFALDKLTGQFAGLAAAKAKKESE